MKRKRGKKGKSIKAAKVGTTTDPVEPNVDSLSLSGEDESSPDHTEKAETNSRMEIETPSTVTVEPEKPPPPVSLTPPVVVNKPVGRLVYNRVKLKIKPSKALEPQVTSSDAPAPAPAPTPAPAPVNNEPDKATRLIVLEKPVVTEKVEDSANSVPETNVDGSVTQPKKAGSIKIKSSKGFGSSLSPCSNALVPQAAERTQPKEPEMVSREPVYNKKELNDSLEVIKKIMKMEASEPFNAPVNPVALGIPDYFDVIKTPMDFGTICSNLESGVKYMNSEDVYKDVQYIWENCYKYNNKGDYILEIMKRVKKNFSKYWAAAGLYSEQQQGDTKDGNISSHGKSSNKSGNLKNKSRKRHGAKRHKDDCLCAICIMVRRRQEREHIMNPANDQTVTGDGLVQEVKSEGIPAMGTPNDDETSSSSDNSQNEDAEAETDVKGREVKLEKEVKITSQSKQKEENEKETLPDTNRGNAEVEQFQVVSISGAEKDKDIQMVDVGDATKNDTNNELNTKQRKDETAAVAYQKPKELLDDGAKAKLSKNLHERYNNPMVLELCASLFPQNPKSLWTKSHSLVSSRGPSRNSSIGTAIATFIKR